MSAYFFTQTPLKFLVQSFWRDEAFSYLLAKQPIINILSLTAKDFNPPLYYLLLHFWIRIFGSSEIMLRSLSAIFFTLTLYIIYDILTEIFHLSWQKSLAYLLLFILNPILNYYAFEVRMYSLLGFFATCSTYALLKKKNRLYLIITTLGLYTHYFMLFIILFQAVWILFQQQNYLHLKKRLLLWKPFVYPLASFLPWFLFILTQRSGDNSFWIPKPAITDIFYLPSVLYTGFEKDFSLTNYGKFGYTNLVTSLNIVLFFIIGFCLWKIYRYQIRRLSGPKTHLLFLLSLWALLPPLIVFISSLIFSSSYLPRYLLFSTIGLILLVIFLLEQLPFSWKIILLAVILFFTWQYNKPNLKYREKFDFAREASLIKEQMKPSDLVYVADERDFHVAQYYFGEKQVYIYGKRYRDIPLYVGKVLITPNRLRNSLPPYPKKAFVINFNRGYMIALQ